jgi:hypothetical protein
MKLIKYIFIHPSPGVWSKDNNARIRDENRSLGFSLGSFLKRNKIYGDKFDGVYFEGVKKPSEQPNIANKLLIVQIIFDEVAYPKNIDKIKINEYLIDRIYEGINQIKDAYPEISENLITGIEEFRKNGYSCTWIHKKRKYENLKIELHCYLDLEFFNLSLIIYNKDNEILFSKIILSTPPNEFSFKHRFKDIIIKENIVIITDSNDIPFYRFNLSSLT